MSKSAPLWWSKPPAILSYAAAVLSVAAALIAVMLIQALLNATPPMSLFLCAIMFAAWFGGSGSGLFATALSILAFDYFFLPPLYSFVLASGDVPRLAVFGVAALFVISLSAAQRGIRDSLKRSRDDLQTTVRELERLNTTLQAKDAERNAVEQKLRGAERELRATIDTIPTMVVTYRPDGSRDFVNQNWQNYTGLSQQDLEGQHWGLAVHPDDLTTVEREWRTHLATGEGFQMKQRLRRADGEYRWHQIGRVPLRDEKGAVIKWYGTGYDIEDQKRAEDALRRSEAYLAEAQRLSLTGSFGWKITSGKIVWSDETYRIMEIDRSMKPTIDLVLQRVHPDDFERVKRELDRVAREQQDLDFEHRVVMPNGVVKHLHVRGHHRRYEAGDDEIVGAVMDVTATTEAQEALHAAQTELAHVTRMMTLGEMSASIAHEVSQPLAAIVVNGEASLQWLKRAPPDLDEVRDATKRVVSEAERAGQVIRRIRDLAKRGDSQAGQIDINTMIDDVVVLVQREALSHRVALRLQLGSQLPFVHGDRIQLQQVIINLVINGIQAMATVPESERTLIVRTQRHEADQLLVAVEDAGVGIDPEDLSRLFSAFYTTKPLGMGMGLSICRSIIEGHGGRIWASRNAGPGMTFQFTLPAGPKTNGS